MKIYEALRQLLLGYGKFQPVAYQSLNWMERSGMAGGLAVKGEGSEFYVYWCLLGEISTGILQYKNLPSLTDMTFPAKKDSTWLGDVLVMYQNLTFKNSSPGDCPQKNKLHCRLLRHCSCAGCVSATFSSPDPVPSPPWSKLAARSIPPRYHYGKAKIDGISPCFVPLFCFKQCFPVIIYIYNKNREMK